MFDVFTLLIVLVLVHSLTTAAFYIIWQIHSDVPGVREWTLGHTLVTCALILFAARLFVPLALSATLGNAVLLMGYHTIWVGARHFIGAPRVSHKPYIAGIAIVILAILYFSIIDNDLQIRATIIAGTISIYMALLFVSLLKHNKRKFKTVRIYQVVVAAHCLFNILWMLNLPSLLKGNNLLGQNAAYQINFLEAIAMTVLSACTLIAMHAEHLHKELRSQADHDVLTNTMNRRAFFPLAEYALARRTRDRMPISLMMIDLDFFKDINDTHGHSVGDEVLRQTSDIIRSVLRPQDILCRFGGEEFVILCPDAHSKSAHKIAERIRKSIEEHCITANGCEISLTTSIGFATYPSNTEQNNLEALIEAADLALYTAKDNGRNRVEQGNPIWTIEA